MNTDNSAIQPYVDSPEARVHRWVDMSEGSLRRTAAKAANEKHQETLKELVEAHVRIHSASGRTSSNTVRAYGRGIETWLTFCRKAGVDVLRPKRNAGPRYRHDLQTLNLSPASCRVYMGAVNALYRALRWADATKAAPLADVQFPRDTISPWDKRLPYKPEAVAAMLEVANDRDKVMVLLGAHAGLRVSEAASLRWADIDFVSAELSATGKGQKTRRVPLSATLTAALESLAAGPSRSTHVLEGIGAPALRARMRRLARNANVKYEGFHALRHLAGTSLARAGLSDKDVARILGHADPKTAAIYAKWADDTARSVIANW